MALIHDAHWKEEKKLERLKVYQKSAVGRTCVRDSTFLSILPRSYECNVSVPKLWLY